MRASDYDESGHYDCTECGAFVSFRRARLVKMRDAAFGPHFALVCAKH